MGESEDRQGAEQSVWGHVGHGEDLGFSSEEGGNHRGF